MDKKKILRIPESQTISIRAAQTAFSIVQDQISLLDVDYNITVLTIILHNICHLSAQIVLENYTNQTWR